MTKLEFARFLVSRFASLDIADRYDIISCLISSAEELGSEPVHEGLEEFEEWAKTVEEILFFNPDNYKIVSLDKLTDHDDS